MTVVYVPKWGQPKEKLSASELREKYIRESSCLVSIVPGELYPRSLHIEFHGECANIPSHKNSFISTKTRAPFIDPKVRAKLQAMDFLFLREVEAQGKSAFRFGSNHIHLTAILADRSRATNEDNLMSSIKDWLEPSVKEKGGKRKSRGWGVGIVDDDIYAHGYPVTSKMLNCQVSHTTIIIRPLEDMRKALVQFVAEASLI